MRKSTLSLSLLLLCGLIFLGGCASRGAKGEAAASGPQTTIEAQDKFQDQARQNPSGTARDGQFVLPTGDDAPKSMYDPSKPHLATDQIDLDQARDPKADLEHRVIERWALLIAKRPQDAYDYLSPGYRQAHPREAYQKDMQDRAVKWYRVLYSGAECETEDNCKVGTMVYFKIRMSAGTGLTDQFGFAHERWLKIAGVWYLLPEDVAL